MSGMVNIPRDVEDVHYRYKMPVLRAKVEGRGNGIKTLVENLSDIAKALERRPEYPLKFFGFELGALTKLEAQADRHIVNGKHEAEDMAKVLDSFIEKYVLCGKCRNPETDMLIKGENILLKCRACGTITPADVSHKLSTYIIKNPPTPAQKGAAESKEDRKQRKKQELAERKQLDDEDDNDWAVETTPEAVNQRRLALLGTKDRLSAADGEAPEADDAETEGDGGDDDGDDGDDLDEDAKKDGDDDADEKDEKVKEEKPAGPQLVELVKPGTNPIPALQKFWASQPSAEEALRQVKALAEANQWSETNLLKILFGSLFDKDLRKGFVHKARYLRLFVPTQKQQKLVLYCVEKLCQIDANTLPLLNDLLAGLWEEHLIDEDIVDKWYKHPNKDMPEKLSKKIRDASQKFVEWLATAEEDNE